MENLYDLNLAPDRARCIQTELASQVVRRNDFGEIQTVADGTPLHLILPGRTAYPQTYQRSG